MKLGRDVFVALATIVWADGIVTGDEVRALLDAARASGVAEGDREAVRAATRERPSAATMGALSLGPEEKAFVYAIAAWLTRADGKVTPEETDAMAELGDILALSDDDRANAIATSFAIDCFSEEGAAVSVQRLAQEIAGAAT
jgi:hypothetical protein